MNRALEGVEEKRLYHQVMDFLSTWLFFSFSDKLKFSIKVSLSLTLAYMIPMAMGWSQASTAAMTVMLIATTGVVGESVMKGSIRVIGTIVGGSIGLTLIALFPQERMIYLLLVSVLVVLFSYLYNAYQGDSTVFMLSAMMIMMVFDGGKVDDVFLYGVDRTYMTIFGIIVYTLVGLFLWPVKESDTTITDAQELTTLQHTFFDRAMKENSEDDQFFSKITSTQQRFFSSHLKARSASLEMSLHPKLFNSLTHNYKKLSSLLHLLFINSELKSTIVYAKYIEDYAPIVTEIQALFSACEKAWKDPALIVLPAIRSICYSEDKEQRLTHLQKSALVTHANILQKIHTVLRTLADRLNQYNGHENNIEEDDVTTTAAPRFVWLDPEYLRGMVQTFLIFWFAVAMWINFNPPGGFLVVTLATLLSLLTSFSPLKPSLLAMVFSVGFVFALLMYIFVLPNLVSSWQLALFIFLYTFIAFYVINPKISIFFLLGMFTLGISNEMHYNFDIFLITLLVFYLFLAILMLFYYVPFSTKAEHLFLRMVQRLYKHMTLLLSRPKRSGWLQQKIDTFHLLHMQRTANKLTLWASKIDVSLFAPNTKAQLLAFANDSKLLSTRVTYLVEFEAKMNAKPLMAQTENEYSEEVLARICRHIANLESDRLEDIFERREEIMAGVETLIERAKENLDPDAYTYERVTAFYIDVNLRSSVWNTLKKCHNSFSALELNVLQMNRF